MRQLRFRWDGNACVALLLQHRKAHAVQIAHLSLHCGHGFWGLHALHQGRLNLLLQEVLDLLRRDRDAEGTADSVQSFLYTNTSPDRLSTEHLMRYM